MLHVKCWKNEIENENGQLKKKKNLKTLHAVMVQFGMGYHVVVWFEHLDGNRSKSVLHNNGIMQPQVLASNTPRTRQKGDK